VSKKKTYIQEITVNMFSISSSERNMRYNFNFFLKLLEEKEAETSAGNILKNLPSRKLEVF
jgi:hypothetical protein